MDAAMEEALWAASGGQPRTTIDLAASPGKPAAALVKELIGVIGDDPNRDGLKDTPARVVKSWTELFGGYGEDPKKHLEKTFAADSSQMVSVNGIDFYSTCEHHMLPFYGTVDIAYIPEGRVVGLSKFARVVNGYARRLQIQERLTNEIAEAIETAVQCRGVAVRVQAKHMCMLARGVKTPNTTMTTTALRGVFLTDTVVRQEWLASL